MDAFHITFIVLFPAMAAVRIYYRLLAGTGRKEKEKKTAEPATILVRTPLRGPAMLAILVSCKFVSFVVDGVQDTTRILAGRIGLPALMPPSSVRRRIPR
jgi:hypothetical protein